MKAHYLWSAALIFPIFCSIAIGVEATAEAKGRDVSDVIKGPAAISKKDMASIKLVLSDSKKDRDTLELRSLRARKNKLGIYVCGEANKKNEVGKYRGFRRFIAFRLSRSDQFTLLKIGGSDQPEENSKDTAVACESLGM